VLAASLGGWRPWLRHPGRTTLEANYFTSQTGYTTTSSIYFHWGSTGPDGYLHYTNATPNPGVFVALSGT